MVSSLSCNSLQEEQQRRNYKDVMRAEELKNQAPQQLLYGDTDWR